MGLAVGFFLEGWRRVWLWLGGGAGVMCKGMQLVSEASRSAVFFYVGMVSLIFVERGVWVP